MIMTIVTKSRELPRVSISWSVSHPKALVLSRSWRRVLNSCVYEEHLKALVIDEAHCVQKWLILFQL